ncbi:zinc-finger homeodomain protein 5-like [Carex rostrata]
MDLRRQEEERGYNPSPSLSPAAPSPPPPPAPPLHPIKDSAFSKPLLPLNSSLLQRGETRNGGTGYALAPSPFTPTPHRHHAMMGRIGGGSLKFPASVTTSSSNSMQTEVTWHYRECQKNHAAGIGGHVVDGCCEFMLSDDVTLKCAACGCHRSFHRKVCSPNPNPSGGTPVYSQNGVAVHRSLLPPSLPPPPIPPPSQPHRSTTDQSSSEEMIGGTPHQSQITATASASPTKKRHRTKFTPEQKEKMFKFAESLSWRFQKPDDAAIDEFCAEAGVNRQVLKVWMHNNKYTYKKEEQYQPLTLPPPQQLPQEGPHQDHQQIA